jgi:uncharacterized protein
VPQDDREAVRFYKLAADQGFAMAQYNLALMYQDGRGVPKDDREALHLFKLAARGGDEYAQNALKRRNETW